MLMYVYTSQLITIFLKQLQWFSSMKFLLVLIIWSKDELKRPFQNKTSCTTKIRKVLLKGKV